VSAAVLAGGLGSSATAAAATTCSGTLSHTTVALLDVPAGSTCVLQSVTVSSAASVEGTLDASSGGASHINGGLTINGGSARFIGGSIGGAVKIENTPAGSVTDLEAGQGVGLSIGGAVEMTGNAGAVRLANLSSGSVIITGNSGHITLSGDHIGGPLSAKNDTGGVTLSGNTVSGALTCSGNSPQPSDAGTANSTGGAGLGQCAPTGRPGDQHAIDHSYQVTENQTLVVPAPGVLAGSSDGAGHTLAAVLVNGPAHGTLALNADGSFTYTPTAGFHGSDSFTYTANDGLAASNTATATIQVNGPPVAVNDSYDALEGGTLAVLAPGVLGNDTDPSGLPLTAALGSGPAHGTLTLHSDGSFTYTPTAGFHGTDSFTYTAHDAFLGSNTATVTIHVRAPPVAANDSYDVNEGASLSVAAPGVLGNDTDSEGLAITAVLGTNPAHGMLTLNANGSFTYVPTAGFSGSDSFTYTAHDTFQGSNTATVTIHVHAPPVAVDDSYDVNTGATLAVAAPGILGNDSDPGGLALTAVLGTGPAHGALTLNTNGSFGYTPTAGFNGTDSFTYTAHDTFQGSNTATVTIHVHGAPVAVDDSYDVNEGASLTVAAPGVLGNDSDPGGLALSAVLATGPPHGALTFNADGSFTYTPTAGFSGTDSFTYTAHDAFLGSNTATVTIHVHAPPVAVNDPYDVNEGASLTVAAPGVLGNDSDPGGLSLSAVLGAGPTHGALTFNADGSFTYTPTAGFSGSDSFTYTAHDAFQGSNTATVTIHVHAPPVAANDSYNVTQGATLTVPAPGVLGNDSDPGGLSLSAVLGTGPAHGALTFNADGSFTYVPTSGFSGTDSFTYTAHDAFQGSNLATVTIHVNAPPAVSSTIPAGGATQRPLSQAVTVNFNESIDATAGAFKLECPTGTSEAFTSSPGLPGSGTTFVLTPSGPLPAGTTCTVTVVASHVTATGSGVPMAADFVFSFSTGATPAVTSTTPASGATNVPLGQAVTVTFNEPVKASAGSFALECPGGTSVAFTVPTTSPSSSYQIDPSAPLPQGTVCTVTVKASGVTSVDPGDVPLPANDVFSFTTGTAPIVSATAPSNGATNQALSPSISVTFNEPVNVTSASAFSLACPSGTNEPITVTPTPLNGNTTFTLTPNSPLPQGTTCTITVNHADVSGAAAGIPMAADFTASFTTGSQPTVSSTTPANGATGVSPSGAVTISFFENVAVSSSSAFDIECPTGTPEPFTLSPVAPGNVSTFTLTPTAPLPSNTLCTVTVVASDVTSTPPSSIPMPANYVFSFTTSSVPVAANDSYSSIGNVGITVPAASGVLANDTLNGNSITAFDSTSVGGGTVTMTTTGANAGAFIYTPAAGFSGSDSFTYTLGGSSTATVAISVSAPVWFIDSADTGGNGTLAQPFSSIAAFDTANTGAALHPANGQTIFIYTGSGYSSGLTLRSSQIVVGQGASAPLASIAGITVPAFSDVLPGTGGALPAITTTSGAGITLSTGNTIRGVGVGATAGAGVSGSSPGALTLGSPGPNSDVTVANTTAGADGVDLSGSGNWSVGASISATGGFSLDVTGATGTDAFSGPVTGTGKGISLTGNSGTINFTGGVALSTGANPAFTATGGGTISITCTTPSDATCAGNTLTTTTATALNVSGTAIGSTGLNFRSISAGPFSAPPIANGAQGIVLSSTGAGPFNVTGTGSAGSGGTISKVESTSVNSAEVSLTNTGAVSLNEMTIIGDPSTANDDESGIFATNVNGFTVTNSSVTNNVGPQIFLQYTSASTLAGPFKVNGNAVSYQGSRSSGSGIQLEFHGSGTVTGHVHGNTEGDPANATAAEFASDGGEGIDLVSDGGGTVTADVSNNTINRVLSSYGMNLQAGGNTAGGTLNATVASNTIHMDQATSADGITVVSGTNTANHAAVCLNMTSNTSAAAGTAAQNEQFPFDGDGVSLVQNGQTGDSTFAIQGYAGGATDLAAVQGFVIAQNTLSGVSDPDDEAIALIQNSAANGFTNVTCPTAP